MPVSLSSTPPARFFSFSLFFFFIWVKALSPSLLNLEILLFLLLSFSTLPLALQYLPPLLGFRWSFQYDTIHVVAAKASPQGFPA